MPDTANVGKKVSWRFWQLTVDCYCLYIWRDSGDFGNLKLAAAVFTYHDVTDFGNPQLIAAVFRYNQWRIWQP